jgi:hypothetical protein
MFLDEPPVDPRRCYLEQRSDGAIVVRVPSRSAPAGALPEAVFAFRAGDPQFAFWQRQFCQVQHAAG